MPRLVSRRLRPRPAGAVYMEPQHENLRAGRRRPGARTGGNIYPGGYSRTGELQDVLGGAAGRGSVLTQTPGRRISNSDRAGATARRDRIEGRHLQRLL